MERDGLGGFELVALAFGCVAAVLIGAVWLGASLAAALHGTPTALPVSAASQAISGLPSHFGDPAVAWASPYSGRLPGPVLYWICTIIAVAVLGVAAAFVGRWLGHSKVGTSTRRPLGVDARPRFARRRDLAPLLIKAPQPGRFVVAKFGRSLVATESSSAGGVAKPSQRRGDRGALALIGPSRSGKTTAAVGGILEWEGPAVLSSVKADLLAVTRGWRSSQGTVRIYDPTSSTIAIESSARWSPLQQAHTILGAQRAARALCDAAPRGGVEGGMDYWLAQAEILLSGLMYVARHVHRDMAAVCELSLIHI